MKEETESKTQNTLKEPKPSNPNAIAMYWVNNFHTQIDVLCVNANNLSLPKMPGDICLNLYEHSDKELETTLVWHVFDIGLDLESTLYL